MDLLHNTRLFHVSRQRIGIRHILRNLVSDSKKNSEYRFQGVCLDGIADEHLHVFLSFLHRFVRVHLEGRIVIQRRQRNRPEAVRHHGLFPGVLQPVRGDAGPPGHRLHFRLHRHRPRPVPQSHTAQQRHQPVPVRMAICRGPLPTELPPVVLELEENGKDSTRA